ncbi:sugar transferase [Mariniflexile ostreae]|uniref:Sugar transferase n=1 Tax=Mariniflexile ostreae TaxID=1520892 RepID=A0ABV5FDZ3_9FLAO
MIKRAFDFIFSLLGIVFLLPLLLIIAIIIKIDSKGPVLYVQNRVGKNNKDFDIFKFRTMYLKSESDGLLTLGNNDTRITKMGYFLRRYKIDEFPQLLNILKGDMSFVGPRPDLKIYVNQYKPDDYVVLSLRPGITGLASIHYRNEVELLKTAEDPEEYYIKTIIPDKLKYNKIYLEKHNLLFDIKLIFITIFKVLFK